MIDLRMVADDRGNSQLQYRRRDISVDAGGNLCDGGDWLEWKSVPIVHDPSQFVDRVEISEAKKSGAKPDGGLTREQVEELLEDFQLNRDAYLKNVSTGYGEHYKSHNQGKADGISVCLLALKEKLGKQPDEPSVDKDQDSESRLDGVCKLHPINNSEVVEASGKYYFLDGHEIQAWVLSQKVTFIADRSHAFDLIASVD